MVITVYGASSCELDETYYDAAFAVGELIAQRGHTVVYGGGDSGLMGSVARGMTAKGGRLVGIAPKLFDEPGVLYQGNDRIIFTDTMSQRKSMMEDMADAFLVLPGGVGTYEEFLETLTLKQLGLHAKAIAVYNYNGCYELLDAMLRRSVEERFTTGESYGLFRMFTQTEPMLDYIEGYRAEPKDYWKKKLFPEKGK